MVPKLTYMTLPRLLLIAVGGFGIIAISFVGTLFAIDNYLPAFSGLPAFTGPSIRDNQRVKDVAVLKNALENYRKARGGYPNFPDNPVSDLRKDLVDGGFLKSIPNDPSPQGRYRYTNQNSDGKSYGLLITLEGAPGACVTVVGTNPGWWGPLAKCPF
jgi:hypothetical protein